MTQEFLKPKTAIIDAVEAKHNTNSYITHDLNHLVI